MIRQHPEVMRQVQAERRADEVRAAGSVGPLRRPRRRSDALS